MLSVFCLSTSSTWHSPQNSISELQMARKQMRNLSHLLEEVLPRCFQLTLTKPGPDKGTRKKEKKKKDTANLRTLSSSQQENTLAAVPAEAPQVAALQDSLQTERN